MQAEMPPGHRTWETGMRPSRVHPALALLEGKATSHAEDGGQRDESRRSFCTKKDPGARETGIVALLMCGQAAYVHTSDGVLLQGVSMRERSWQPLAAFPSCRGSVSVHRHGSRLVFWDIYGSELTYCIWSILRDT